MTQATGTASLQQSTLAPAVNGAGAPVQQVQQPQPEPTGIAGNGQSTIASSPVNDPDFLAVFAVGFEIFCMTPTSAQKARQNLKDTGLTQEQLTKVNVQVEKFRQQQEKDRALALQMMEKTKAEAKQ